MLPELYDLDDPYFRDLLTSELGTGKKRALVYVHGLSNTFQDAAFRAAQLKHDLQFQGPVAFFSWPSGGSVWGYVKAFNNADWSQVLLATFLRELLSSVGDGELIVVAHSMGIRVVSDAIRSLGSDKARITELILASPDIDEGVFTRDVMPILADRSSRLTVYTSEKDLALSLSAKVGGARRAGGMLAIAHSAPLNIDIIDTTEVSGPGFLSHSDYAEARPAITDLTYLINLRLPAEKRSGLRRITERGPNYWQLVR